MMKLVLKKIVLLSLFAASFVACSSAPKLSENPAPESDYTDKDVHDSEVKRIYEMLEKSPVQALWRAKILGDENLCRECAEYVRDVCVAHVEQDDRLEAYTMYSSLVAAGYSDLAQEIMSAQKMNALYFDGVPGITTKAQPRLAHISDYIQGTVTVWVDLGIKVKRGMGYADRVIGSGFFIDPRGYIITNHHVIEEIVSPKNSGYGKVFIKMAEDSDLRIPARVVGYDSVHDLALLKTEAEVPYTFNLGSSSELHVGDKIYAIGSPLGLERTLTSGVVSATDRKLFSTGSVIQIDAAINSGNSGGPFIDENGRVQGIVFAGILQYSGLNFAIPVEYLKQDLPILFHGGKRRFPWIGAYGRTARAGRTSYGLEVQYFMPGSAMARVGMRVGDVITSLDGKKISTLEEMQDVLRGHVPGKIIGCEYIRDGEKKDCLLYLSERPENPGYTIYQNDTIEHSFVPLFGMEMTPSSTTNSRTFTITRVIPGSAADENGFSENDPVTVGRIQFDDAKTVMLVPLTTKNRRKGYLDMSVALQTYLDSPYYF